MCVLCRVCLSRLCHVCRGSCFTCLVCDRTESNLKCAEFHLSFVIVILQTLSAAPCSFLRWAVPICAHDRRAYSVPYSRCPVQTETCQIILYAGARMVDGRDCTVHSPLSSSMSFSFSRSRTDRCVRTPPLLSPLPLPCPFSCMRACDCVCVYVFMSVSECACVCICAPPPLALFPLPPPSLFPHPDPIPLLTQGASGH